MRSRLFIVVVAVFTPLSLLAQPVTSTSSNTWISDGIVSSAVSHGEVTYLAGSFTRIGRRIGSLAQLDPLTGQPFLNTPRVDAGDVVDLEDDGVGGYYLAGWFTRVGGLPRNGVAHITSLGAVDIAFSPSGFDAASGIALSGSGLFAAVHQSSGGTLTTTVVLLDAVTGATRSWSPAKVPGAGTSRASSLRVYGGAPGSVLLHDGQDVVALDSATGALQWETTAHLIATAGDVGYIARGLSLHRLDLTSGTTTTLVSEASCADYSCGPTGLVLHQGRLFFASYRFFSKPLNQIVSVRAFDPVSGADLGWSPRFGSLTASSLTTSQPQVLVVGGRLVLQTSGNVMAFDPQTGAATGWSAHVLGGAVLDALANGSQLVVAGAFRGAGGVPRDGLAAVGWPDGAPTPFEFDVSLRTFITFEPFTPIAFVGPRLFVNAWTSINEVDPTTGATLSTTPAFGYAVAVMAGAGTRLFIAGSFADVNGQPRSRLASFDVSGTTPVLETWAPTVGPTQSLSPRGVANLLATTSVVLISGAFGDVNGEPRNGLAALDAATGALLPWSPAGLSNVSFALGADRLWVSGFRPLLSPPVGGQASFDFSGNLLPWRAAPPPIPVEAGHERTQQRAAAFGNRLYVGLGYALEQSTGAISPWTPDLDESATSGLGTQAIWSAAADLGVVFHQTLRNGFGFYPRTNLPARPLDLHARVSSNSVNLSWTGTSDASAYIVEAGSQPGARDLAAFQTGTAPTLSVSAPDGTYYVRVRARTAAGDSPASIERRVVVGAGACGEPPAAPFGLVGSVSGDVASLRWSAQSSDQPLQRYVVEVRSSSPRTRVAVIDAGTQTSIAGTLPRGYYVLRVRAENGCGLSDPTDDLILSR